MKKILVAFLMLISSLCYANSFNTLDTPTVSGGNVSLPFTWTYDGDQQKMGNTDQSKFYVGGWAQATGTLAGLLGGGDFYHQYWCHNVATDSTTGVISTTDDATSTSYCYGFTDAGLWTGFQAPAGATAVFNATAPFSFNLLTGAATFNGLLSAASGVSATSINGVTTDSATNKPVTAASLNGGTLPVSATTLTEQAGSVPYTLSKASVAVGIAPTGTFLGSSTGVLTLGTALPAPYSSGTGLYLIFPSTSGLTGANSVKGFWTVCTTGTACTVYNSVYDPTVAGEPVNGTTTAFSGLTGAAYVGITTAVTLRTTTLPGGVLSSNGFIEVDPQWYLQNSANNKTLDIVFGGTNYLALFSAVQNAASINSPCKIRNAGSVSSQIGNAVSGLPFSLQTTAPAYSSVNTSSSVSITHTGQLAVATDYIILSGSFIRVTP